MCGLVVTVKIQFVCIQKIQVKVEKDKVLKLEKLADFSVILVSFRFEAVMVLDATLHQLMSGLGVEAGLEVCDARK